MFNGKLWKPGVNGLGVLGFHYLPYRVRFDRAARSHDANYDKGGSEQDRITSDDLFLDDELSVCKTPIQKLTAYVYYALVRLFGNLFFHYY